MTEVFALEIWNIESGVPYTVLYRSDLYLTKEQALKAFCDKETGEAFTALYDLQNWRDSPFQISIDEKEGTAPYLIDDYWQAYHDGNQEIIEIVDGLIAWVQGEESLRTEYFNLWPFEFGVQNFTLHTDD